jgi:short-subunit dehydrogenase
MYTKENLMKVLNLTEAQAIELMEYDLQVNRMSMKEVDSDLTQEQKEMKKKMSQVARKVSAYGQATTRKKVADNEKAEIIDILKSALEKTGATEFEVINNEREFTFKMNDRKFKIVLSVPRK